MAQKESHIRMCGQCKKELEFSTEENVKDRLAGPRKG